jgi:hypothetical protein
MKHNKQLYKGYELSLALELSATTNLKDATELADYLREIRRRAKGDTEFLTCAGRPLHVPAKNCFMYVSPYLMSSEGYYQTGVRFSPDERSEDWEYRVPRVKRTSPHPHREPHHFSSFTGLYIY